MGYLVFYLSVCGKNAQNYKIFEDSDKFSTFYSFSISILFYFVFFSSQHVHTATPALVSTVLLIEDVSPISLIVLTLVNLQVR